MNTAKLPLPGRVRAYTVVRYLNEWDRVETLYFITTDGETYASPERPYDDRFNQPGTVWTKLDGLPPMNAGFIGCYADPR